MPASFCAAGAGSELADRWVFLSSVGRLVGRARSRTGATAGSSGDVTHPKTLAEIPESRVAAPVAAVVGVEPGAASPAHLGEIGVSLQHAPAAVARALRGLPTLDILFAVLLILGGAFLGPEVHIVARGAPFCGGLGCRHGPVGGDHVGARLAGPFFLSGRRYQSFARHFFCLRSRVSDF